MKIFTIITLVAHCSFAASPSATEMEDAAQWGAAKFAAKQMERPVKAGIEVLANNDPVQQNVRAGKPMNIAGKQYTRGLYCHAVSKLLVRLNSPAKSFNAVVGVDTNDQTSGGRGSGVFIVRAGSKEVWNSGLMREGMAGKEVSVDLGGATEIALEITDGGDGISCDQSDWADARVTLNNGSVVWLGDLLIEGDQRVPYSMDPFFSFVYDGKPSSEFLNKWKCARESKRIDNDRTRHTIRYTDPETRLEVWCEGVAYDDFPTVEWTLYFKNNGDKESLIISDIQAIDTAFTRGGAGEYTLFHNKGDNCTADSFEPLVDELKANADLRIANTGGRPTQIAFP
ncbi:MAG: NPCBM/NEW2 domain-containing protein, partial [Candidatus Hydrogenedentes bacterium]|nr:NPCBM/NEW2 domain-containing protein [Candidatus Hydrogenedentota bacterium]